MIKVAPSILSADYVNLQRDIEMVEKGGAEYLHIDVMDGTFVPSISYGPGFVKAIRKVSNLFLDVHLMVEKPGHLIQDFADAGADLIGIHVEATQHIHGDIQTINNAGMKSEVVINPGTPVSAILPILHMVDQVLVMTVNPGFGGQKFLPETVAKIAELNQLKADKGYTYDIEIDGGVNADTVVACYEAGATVAVAGSYVFNDANPVAKINALKTATK
ncbi:ribulose-phosphate 3-epimerase [Paucilactobacillus nenjiangensis]|uniref:ribulose-phosphate 3-epimerase n=1 Tax=Paucilactobacillus nenjiangensis TaxID=1296540 RepID=UPI003BAE7E64